MALRSLRRRGRGRPARTVPITDLAHERTWVLIVPTHTHQGGALDLVGREPEFVASLNPIIAVPPGDHGNSEVVEVSGTVLSTPGSAPTVTLRDRNGHALGSQPAMPRVEPPSAARTVQPREPTQFAFALDRPCPADESGELVIEIDDGDRFTRRLLHVLPRLHPDGFAGFVETPADPMVLGHTLQYACFRGWIGSARGRRCRARVIPGRGEVVEVEAELPRPDVLESVGAVLGLEQAMGFTVFLELPQPLDEPLPVVVELTDGDHVRRSATYFVTPRPGIHQLDTFLPDPPAFRSLAFEHLRGDGLEFGALHSPLPVDPKIARVRYADQYDDAYARTHLPSAFVTAYGADLVEVDFIVDLDREDLSQFREKKFDFFVASGVLEHLANPLGFLVRLHDVMKPGARFFLAVPDRDFTFDTNRPCTTNEHLWDEYERGIVEIPDDHVVEYIERTVGKQVPDDPAARAALVAEHRASGPHAHVWTQQSFDEFLRWAIDRVPMRFEVVGGARSRDAEGNIVYVLEKRGA